jgi:acyl-CoA thioester hydrolase
LIIAGERFIVKPMLSECSLTVRTYECDGNDHVNNAVYLNYLEFARHKFLKDIGFDYPGASRAGYMIYVARVEIDYRKSAVLDDTLTIKSWPIKKGAVSGVIAQEIKRGDDIIAEAKVTWAFVDSKGTPAKLPPELDRPGLKPD